MAFPNERHEMNGYINRTPVAVATEFVGESTVSVSTRVVGTTAVIDVTEESPADARPVSKTRLVGIVRNSAKPHVSKPKAVGLPIADSEFVRESHSVDKETGHRVASKTRVRVVTFAVGSR